MTAVHGMGGIGKTVAVRALCDDPHVQAAYPDGILWAAVGQTPDLAARLRDLDAQHAQLTASLQTLQLRLAQLGTPPGPWARGDEAHALLTDYRQLCEDLSTDGSADEIAFTFDRERPVPTPKPRTEDDPATTTDTDLDGDPAVEPAGAARAYDERDDGDDTDDLCF